jgi:hypothetical protein
LRPVERGGEAEKRQRRKLLVDNGKRRWDPCRQKLESRGKEVRKRHK